MKMKLKLRNIIVPLFFLIISLLTVFLVRAIPPIIANNYSRIEHKEISLTEEEALKVIPNAVTSTTHGYHYKYVAKTSYKREGLFKLNYEDSIIKMDNIVHFQAK